MKKQQKPKAVRLEEKRQRKFVKEVLWPFLVENTKHVNEAKNVLEASVVGIQQAYDAAMLQEQKKWSATKMEEFDIDKTVLKRSDYEIEHKLIELFAEETLSTTKALIQGMSQVIDSFVREELQERTLDTLKAQWLD